MDTHTRVHRCVVTDCQLALLLKEKKTKQQYVCREKSGRGDVWLSDSILVQCQQQGVKLMRLFRGPITTNPAVL